MASNRAAKSGFAAEAQRKVTDDFPFYYFTFYTIYLSPRFIAGDLVRDQPPRATRPTEGGHACAVHLSSLHPILLET